MSLSFTDAMKKPLKSKEAPETTVTTESALTLEDIEKELFEGTEGGNEETLAPATEDADIEPDDIASIVDDIDDEDDIEDMTDAELAALDAELSGNALDNAANIEDEEEVTLSPEEEIEADDMMKVAATTVLINDEMNAEERCAFLKDEKEITTAINEGFLTETDANMLAVESGLVTEANMNQRMIIRLDAASRKKQLYALGVTVSAAAHNDPDYIKYKKIMRAKKVLRKKLEKKYHAEATKRMKVYFARLRKSKSTNLANVAKKAGK